MHKAKFTFNLDSLQEIEVKVAENPDMQLGNAEQFVMKVLYNFFVNRLDNVIRNTDNHIRIL